MQATKNYYLPSYLASLVGTILLLMGLGITFGGIEFRLSLWANLQRMFLNFESVSNFIVSFILLLFKAGFIAGGYFYIKYASGVERARLDDKGFYYREIPKGGGMAKLGIDTGSLSFSSYHTIRDITYEKTIWTGGHYFDTGYGHFTISGVGCIKRSGKTGNCGDCQSTHQNPMKKVILSFTFCLLSIIIKAQDQPIQAAVSKLLPKGYVGY